MCYSNCPYENSSGNCSFYGPASDFPCVVMEQEIEQEEEEEGEDFEFDKAEQAFLSDEIKKDYFNAKGNHDRTRPC